MTRLYGKNGLTFKMLLLKISERFNERACSHTHSCVSTKKAINRSGGNFGLTSLARDPWCSSNFTVSRFIQKQLLCVACASFISILMSWLMRLWCDTNLAQHHQEKQLLYAGSNHTRPFGEVCRFPSSLPFFPHIFSSPLCISYFSHFEFCFLVRNTKWN